VGGAAPEREFVKSAAQWGCAPPAATSEEGKGTRRERKQGNMRRLQAIVAAVSSTTRTSSAAGRPEARRRATLLAAWIGRVDPDDICGIAPSQPRLLVPPLGAVVGAARHLLRADHGSRGAGGARPGPPAPHRGFAAQEGPRFAWERPPTRCRMGSSIRASSRSIRIRLMLGVDGERTVGVGRSCP
jgi:hypothetical protein